MCSKNNTTMYKLGVEYCNFTNFRCVKISVSSDRGAFGVVLISVSVDVVVITQCIFLILGVFLISVKPMTTEITENKTTPKICKITVRGDLKSSHVDSERNISHLRKNPLPPYPRRSMIVHKHICIMKRTKLSFLSSIFQVAWWSTSAVKLAVAMNFSRYPFLPFLC